MGILNVTPDSFSDGGLHADTEHAVAHGFALASQGADIVDVGGESTRPGATPVPVGEELARVLPVVRELADGGVRVSIDTMHAPVARAALAAGAYMVNDVSGGLADPLMADVIADTGVPYVVMHWRAPSRIMRQHAHYKDVVTDVHTELRRRVEALTDHGVREEQIVLDPGLGFAKTPCHDWTLLSHLATFTRLGFPVLIGASRKSFLTTVQPGADTPAAGRDTATTAVSALAAAAGAWAVRVHNVPANRDAVRVAAAWCAAAPTPTRAGTATQALLHDR
ncbi:dihydropteroate synthase [Streptomyces sp. BH-SS-21]|uniref:Dihydropteroate synthase n=1 Tax=Streptomyces liliiviolaceus TaxID=2823109 RepID=A0A940YAD3_9ACTN|nr:dihydropteroate synthase [Streptomyces liliiviolaceus]MBQ0855540.1 dihydropteroate synthase [Streptomyces liliiviolaceus]